MRLLLICERKEEADRIQRGLRDHHYAVDVAGGEAEVTRLTGAHDYDAIVAEYGVGPTENTVDVIKRLRAAGVGDPLLVVSADVEEETVRAVMAAGADQVMDRGHTFDELLMRVRSLLRNCKPTPADVLTYKDVELDLPRMIARRESRGLELIGKPYALLEFFLREPETVHTREEIGRAVWDSSFDADSNVIDVTMSKLRSQLDRPFDVPYLHTVVGRGYTLSERPPGRGD